MWAFHNINWWDRVPCPLWQHCPRLALELLRHPFFSFLCSPQYLFLTKIYIFPRLTLRLTNKKTTQPFLNNDIYRADIYHRPHSWHFVCWLGLGKHQGRDSNNYVSFGYTRDTSSGLLAEKSWQFLTNSLHKSTVSLVVRLPPFPPWYLRQPLEVAALTFNLYGCFPVGLCLV